MRLKNLHLGPNDDTGASGGGGTAATGTTTTPTQSPGSVAALDGFFKYLNMGIDAGTKGAGTYQAWADPAAYNAQQNQNKVVDAQLQQQQQAKNNQVYLYVLGGLVLLIILVLVFHKSAAKAVAVFIVGSALVLESFVTVYNSSV